MTDNPIEELNDKQHQFMINYYVKGMTQEEAYLEAGYDAKPGASAKSAASKLANKDKMKRAVAELDEKDMTEPNRKLGEIQISDRVRQAIDTLEKVMNGEIEDFNKARVMKESAVEILDRAGINKKKPRTEEGQLNFNFDLSESEAREIESEWSDLGDDSNG